jgi:hypothetical protein
MWAALAGELWKLSGRDVAGPLVENCDKGVATVSIDKAFAPFGHRAIKGGTQRDRAGQM